MQVHKYKMYFCIPTYFQKYKSAEKTKLNNYPKNEHFVKSYLQKCGRFFAPLYSGQNSFQKWQILSSSSSQFSLWNALEIFHQQAPSKMIVYNLG